MQDLKLEMKWTWNEVVSEYRLGQKEITNRKVRCCLQPQVITKPL
jgi:hypothetical protein